MTQFALATTSNSCPNLKPIEELRDDFLLGVANDLFPRSSADEIFVLDVEGNDIDSLMLNAQKLVIESSKFEETALCHTIVKIAPAIDELVFWYGSDYGDLEYVYDVPTLLNKLEDAVRDSSCELYIHYKKTKES